MDKKIKCKEIRLCGLYFHTFKDDVVENQGTIIKKIKGSSYYLIQFFSWIDGSCTNKKLFHISKMKTWNFYKTFEEMDQFFKDKQ